MKKFNFTFMNVSLILLLLTGCMPDSLTKYQKDAPKKKIAATTTTPTYVDSSGNSVDPDDLEFPTKFYYYTEDSVTDKALTVGSSVTINPTFDGSLADSSLASAIMIGCTINQALPAGLTLNPTTCVISGTPTTISSNAGALTNYTITLQYKGADYDGTNPSILTAQINIGAFQVPSSLSYTQNDKLVINLTTNSGNTFSSILTNTDNAVAYTRRGVITTSAGVSGIVKYTNSTLSEIGVYRVTPITVGSSSGFSTAGSTSYISISGNTKTGKILKISGNVLYVETLTPTTTFAVGDTIGNNLSYASKTTSTTITSIDSSYTLGVTPSSFDIDTQYFSSRYSITKVTQMYEVGQTIPNLAPIASDTIKATNGITYSISPALPSGLDLDSTTGVISGAFDDVMSSTAFTITATNLIGSTSKTIYLAAIRSPQDLSYTQRQLVTVNSNSLFNNGELIFQPIAAPLTTSVQGKIRNKVSTNMLDIFTQNGTFLEEASLDSGNTYFSEKTYITTDSDPNYYNLKLKVGGGEALNFAAGDYVSNAAGAKGRVIYSDTTNDALYIQFLTPNTSSIVTFYEGDNIDNASTYSASEATVSYVDGDNLIIEAAGGHGIVKGDDVATTNNNGYAYNVSTNNIYVSDINGIGTSYISTADDIQSGIDFSAGVSIANITHDTLIIADRNKPFQMKANLSAESSALYSITPALPTGLSLNSATGVISGTPTQRVVSKKYIVTAINLLGSTSYAFNLEVRDYFGFAETSSSKSFITHKFGTKNTNRPCRINAGDIIATTAPSSDTLDIGCYLEAEELELYYTKLKMNASVGAGVCEYVSFTPFAFWQYAPATSSTTSEKFTFRSECIGGANTAGYSSVSESPSAELCIGNYTDIEGPNCDSGSVSIETLTDTNSDGTCDKSTLSTLSCGGKTTRCLAGPIKSVITSEAALEAGVRGQVVNSTSGVSQTWTIDSPADFLDVTSLRVANDVSRNLCTNSRADADTLADGALATSKSVAPFGQASIFYEFKCLDAAQDVKARIRLVVRDWNRTFNITSGITAKAPALMNTNAANGSFGSFNNKVDWDDDYTDSDVDTIYTETGIAPACGTVSGYPFPQGDI